MERKLFLSICLILVLGQLYGCNSCIENERKALLELKKYIIPKIDEAYRDDVLLTWTNDTKSDCCRWKGVECNRTNGHVTGLSVSEMVFKEYILLNLSLLHPFEAVRSLNLSSKPYYNRFIGFFDDVEGYKSLKRLRNLEILDLSYNYFNQSILPFLNAATSLTTLHLNANFMGGVFRIKELNNLTNLELLDLGQNSFDGSIPELKTLTNLKLLNLGGNRLNGSISVVCELKNLRELNLRENNFVGQLPLCLGSLKNLRVLDLSSNQLSGNLPSSFSNLESLEYLSLLDQNFTGLLSLSPLANLTKLKVFKLSSTSDMVRVETESTWQPKFHLSVVVLRFCKLEKIPSFLVYQKNLRLIDLSGNRLSGNIPTSLLANLPELEVLLLQNNLFTIFQMPTIVHNLKGLDISANDIHYKKQANLRGRF